MLKKYDVHVWDKAEVETTRGHFSGKILPRAENTDDIHIVMKVATRSPSSRFRKRSSLTRPVCRT